MLAHKHQFQILGGNLSLYKYMSFSNLQFLLEGTIRFTQPKAFNDPFELLPELLLEKTMGDLSLDVLSEPRIPCPARLPDDFQSQFCNDISSRELLAVLSDLIGILCLSKTANSLLMWSHYSDEYKGAVVEFDEEHEFFTGLIPIQYEENRPKLNYELLADEKKHLRVSELCFKSKEWQYENEHRLVRSLADCKKGGAFNGFDIYTMDVPRECIKSITLGERMSIDNQRYVVGKIHDTNISLSLAAISNWGYGFRSELIKFDKPFSDMSPVISPRTANIFKDLKGEHGEISRWMLKNHPMSNLVNKTL